MISADNLTLGGKRAQLTTSEKGTPPSQLYPEPKGKGRSVFSMKKCVVLVQVAAVLATVLGSGKAAKKLELAPCPGGAHCWVE